MDPHDLPKYAEVLATIRDDVSKFKLGWRLLPEISDSLSFGRTDVSVYAQTGIEVHASEPIEGLAARIFDHLLPSTKKLAFTLLGDPNYADRPGHEKWCAARTEARKALTNDVMPALVAIAEDVLQKNREAQENGSISRRNRHVALSRLKAPMRDALKVGITLEDLESLMSELQTEPEKDLVTMLSELQKDAS